MLKKYFSTDGIRGKVGHFPITVEAFLKIGNALGKILLENKIKKIVLAQDTRASNYMLKSAFMSGVTATGIDIIDMGVISTPAISFITRVLRIRMSVILTGSHNSYDDNGMKFFSLNGNKLSTLKEINIENQVERKIFYHPRKEFGRVINFFKITDLYNVYCVKYFFKKVDSDALREKNIVLDCAHGGLYKMAHEIFNLFKIQYKSIASKPNGININMNCGTTHIKNVMEHVVGGKFDLGVAFDGDGDRVTFVHNDGNIINGDDIVYILLKGQDTLVKSNGVVSTVMSNTALKKYCKLNNINLQHVDVGDRNILKKLAMNNILLGSEPSGHVINLEYSSTGDGLLTTLQILSIISRKKLYVKGLSDMQHMPQVIINTKFIYEKHEKSLNMIRCDVDNIKKILLEKGRVILRRSGTEPTVRIMVEAKEKDNAVHCARYLFQRVKQKFTKVR